MRFKDVLETLGEKVTLGRDNASGSVFWTRPLSGWGRFPVELCHVYRPEKRAEVGRILASRAHPSYIAFGLGRSYGDAALNRESGVIAFNRLDRFISFDEAEGVLECEGGVSFEEIIRFFLPRGFFLPVTPGTKYVTVGGALAADVHGKNHHKDGTLANFVLDLRLLTANGDVVICSPTAESEIFWATIGGMGLTGIILSARIRIRRVESAYVFVDYQKAADLGEVLGLMAESDDRYQYSVAWIDCLARGKSMGRGVLMRGNHAAAADLPPGVGDPLGPAGRNQLSVPFNFPSWTLNRLTAGALNSFYYRRHESTSRKLVGFNQFFYPLDALAHWNRMYGKRGFVQYQVSLPQAKGAEALVKLLETFASTGRPAFLAVVKRFGEANSGLLSFPQKGYTLALDLPASRGLVSFLFEMDKVVLSYGGRVYLAKDSVTTRDHFAAMYPSLGHFRAIKQRVDPRGMFSSSMARRLGIVQG